VSLVSDAAVPTVVDGTDSLHGVQFFATSPAAIHGLHLLIYGFRRYCCQFASRNRDKNKRWQQPDLRPAVADDIDRSANPFENAASLQLP